VLHRARHGRGGTHLRVQPIVQRRGEERFGGVAERVRKVVVDHTARQCCTRAAVGSCSRRGEAIGIIAKALCVYAAELNREICRTAVVLRVKAVGFATGRGPNLNDIHTHAAQAVHHSLDPRKKIEKVPA
jgi:hypothetical protein